MDPLWCETCWSTFKFFIILIVPTYYILCISWIRKCLINVSSFTVNSFLHQSTNMVISQSNAVQTAFMHVRKRPIWHMIDMWHFIISKFFLSKQCCTYSLQQRDIVILEFYSESTSYSIGTKFWPAWMFIESNRVRWDWDIPTNFYVCNMFWARWAIIKFIIKHSSTKSLQIWSCKQWFIDWG